MGYTIWQLLMMKTKWFIFLPLAVTFFACNQSKTKASVSENSSTIDTTRKPNTTLVPFETDTAFINNKRFVLSVFKTNGSEYFEVEKEVNRRFKPILVDSDYTSNNSDLFFKDENHDGFQDIVWTKKWQDHSYLFNPKKENFIEVGEFHDIDTLKISGKQVLFNKSYPLLYLLNAGKEFDWMVKLHSELFIIDSNYQKVSFATLDNFASLKDYNFGRCSASKNVVVNCYVPPYCGKYDEFSIWNAGKSVDSMFMKANRFDSSFIANYWADNYQKLLQYGRVFTVRRQGKLTYF
jgi:hypothetical protein